MFSFYKCFRYICGFIRTVLFIFSPIKRLHWKKEYGKIGLIEKEETVAVAEYRSLQKKLAQVEMENEILKSNSHIRTEARLKLIRQQIGKYPIQILSRTLGTAHSRIYRHLEGKVGKRKTVSERLYQEIRQVYSESNKIYGALKIYAALIRRALKRA